jgi:hypothetical protein
MSVFEYLIKTDTGYIVKSPVRYDSKLSHLLDMTARDMVKLYLLIKTFIVTVQHAL